MFWVDASSYVETCCEVVVESQESIGARGVVGGWVGVIVSYYTLSVLSEALSDSGMAHEGSRRSRHGSIAETRVRLRGKRSR